MVFLPVEKIYQSRAWLHRQYVTLGLSEEEIAAKAKTTRVTINTWLIKFGIITDSKRKI